MNERYEQTSGKWVILAVYVGVLVVTAFLGLVLGIAQPVELNPVLFGVVPLPPTPLGMVTFGVVTVGVGLGVLLAIIHVVSTRFDEGRPSE
ncbi:cox cluster protein [Haloarculaceae archaeon H-GB1-1]|nr:cox cluster protein [Haloarculaceae archaeon H-GB1-1]